MSNNKNVTGLTPNKARINNKQIALNTTIH